MKYEKFRYIYPPRPKNATSPEDIDFFDSTKDFLCQPKIDGSHLVLFLNNENCYIYNRHNQKLTNFQIEEKEIRLLHKDSDGWIVCCGEYCNKNKNDESGTPFNHKLILFDILVYNSEYLIGKTFQERINLLDELFGQNNCEKDYLYNITDNIYRVKTYNTGFKSLYDNWTSKIPLVEGIVMKRSDAKLEMGLSENNNSQGMIKARRKTRNFKF